MFRNCRTNVERAQASKVRERQDVKRKVKEVLAREGEDSSEIAVPMHHFRYNSSEIIVYVFVSRRI